MMGDSYVHVKAPATVQRLDKVTVARMRSSQSIATIAHAVEECTSLLQPQSAAASPRLILFVSAPLAHVMFRSVVYNSLDAQATSVRVSVQWSSKSITVTDNGIVGRRRCTAHRPDSRALPHYGSFRDWHCSL